MFNEGGSLSLKEASGKLFDPSQPVTVEMNSFVNRGKPFRGDIGVAVYDEAGNLKQVVYSDDHLQGGFTERLYGGEQEGWMGTDNLINQAQKSVSVLPVLKTAITVSSLYVQPGRMMVHGMISCR